MLRWLLVSIFCFNAYAGPCAPTRYLTPKSEFSEGSRYHEVYDQVAELFPPHRNLRDLHAAAMPRGNVRLIDAGGGTGLLTRQLLAEDPRRKIELFDTSPEITEIAVRNGISRRRIHHSSVTDYRRSNGQRVADGSIDGIMCNNVLYLLTHDEIKAFFAEARRVLKPGGRLSVASMRTVPPEKTAAFLKKMKAAVEKMEANGRVPRGASSIIFDSNRNLTQNAPTTFKDRDFIALATTYGFRPVMRGSGYSGTAFFVAFEKVD